MESAHPTVRYVIYSKALQIYELESRGWFVHIDGSHESICLGDERPDLREGDEIKISIERVPKEDAKP